MFMMHTLAIAAVVNEKACDMVLGRVKTFLFLSHFRVVYIG